MRLEGAKDRLAIHEDYAGSRNPTVEDSLPYLRIRSNA